MPPASARAIDPREQFRVASPTRTCAVLNTYKQPTVYGLLGRQEFDPEALREEIFANSRADQSFAKNLSELCEQRLGSKLYANLMMLGVAFQLVGPPPARIVPATAASEPSACTITRSSPW